MDKRLWTKYHWCFDTHSFYAYRIMGPWTLSTRQALWNIKQKDFGFPALGLIITSSNFPVTWSNICNLRWKKKSSEIHKRSTWDISSPNGVKSNKILRWLFSEWDMALFHRGGGSQSKKQAMEYPVGSKKSSLSSNFDSSSLLRNCDIGDPVVCWHHQAFVLMPILFFIFFYSLEEKKMLEFTVCL